MTGHSHEWRVLLQLLDLSQKVGKVSCSTTSHTASLLLTPLNFSHFHAKAINTHLSCVHHFLRFYHTQVEAGQFMSTRPDPHRMRGWVDQPRVQVGVKTMDPTCWPDPNWPHSTLLPPHLWGLLCFGYDLSWRLHQIMVQVIRVYMPNQRFFPIWSEKRG